MFAFAAFSSPCAALHVIFHALKTTHTHTHTHPTADVDVDCESRLVSGSSLSPSHVQSDGVCHVSVRVLIRALHGALHSVRELRQPASRRAGARKPSVPAACPVATRLFRGSERTTVNASCRRLQNCGRSRQERERPDTYTQVHVPLLQGPRAWRPTPLR